MLITKRILKKWMLEMIKLSIIIPVLNEEQNLQILLPYLQKHTTTSTEIIVVDGDSSDETINVVRRFNIRLITSNVGRATQMNAGAREAKGNRLYFLHVDCKPPINFENLILSSEFQAGSFRMKFENRHWMLTFCAWFTRFNWQICRGGDRSLFVDKLIFEKLAGFKDIPIMEDYEIVNRLLVDGQFVVLHDSLTSSARMYEKHGIVWLQLVYAYIHLLWFFGANEIALKTKLKNILD